jgi:hypothetical protein
MSGSPYEDSKKASYWAGSVMWINHTPMSILSEYGTPKWKKKRVK